MFNPLNFLLAGKAIFTIVSKATGVRFTYKVKKHAKKDLWFVSVLTGSDNYSNYSYMGTIFSQNVSGVPTNTREFKSTFKSRITVDAPSFKAFRWFFNQLESNGSLDAVEVHHEGRCGRCGRRLTVPESIESGFGPECIQHIGG
jgi:hypothetical protein